MHDFKIVAVLDADLAERPPRDDLKVALDGDPTRVEAELAEHLHEARSALHAAVLAVDPDPKAAIETH